MNILNQLTELLTIRYNKESQSNKKGVEYLDQSKVNVKTLNLNKNGSIDALLIRP